MANRKVDRRTGRTRAALMSAFVELILSRGPIPRSLLALTIAEMQIGLITHWLSAAVFVKSDLIAEALVLNTHALLCARQI